MPRMNYHSVQLLLVAYNQRRRAVEDAKRPNTLTMDTLGAVVFSAAATEGFINEVAEHVDTYRRIGSDLIPDGEQKDKLNRLADLVLDLEERRRPVAEKYAVAWFADSRNSRGDGYLRRRPSTQERSSNALPAYAQTRARKRGGPESRVRRQRGERQHVCIMENGVPRLEATAYTD